MSLTKIDLKKIKNVVDSGNEYLAAKWEKRFQSMDIYMRSRFGNIDDKLESIDRKINQLIRTEDEDIQVAYREIEILKKKVRRLEAKV